MSNKEVWMCTCQGEKAELESKPAPLGMENIEVHAVEQACRGSISQLQSGISNSSGGKCVVGCTQEQPVFEALLDLDENLHQIQFVNLRGAWRAQQHRPDLRAATMASLATYHAYYEAEPVASVAFRSQGRVAFVSPSGEHLRLAQSLANSMEVDLIVEVPSAVELPADRKLNILFGKVKRTQGWLGKFELDIENVNPVDPELCVRCGACVQACPTQSIDPASLSVALDSCDRSGACIKVCGEFKAIRFDQVGHLDTRQYDLVIDASEKSLFSDREAPLGYWFAGASPDLLMSAMLEAQQTVGEFEKPKFFEYRANLCAHDKSGRQGCNACIDTCSTKAIRSVGEKIEVEPHLCLGCGACGSVCPTGALQYATSPAAAMGDALRHALQTFRQNTKAPVSVVFHSAHLAHNWLEGVQKNLPKGSQIDHALLPIEVHHAASVGPDLWLTALAFGASRVELILTDEEARFYEKPLRAQLGWVQSVLGAMGFVDAVKIHRLDQAANLYLSSLSKAPRIEPAVYEMSGLKRGRLEFALEHLATQTQFDVSKPLALQAGSPFGAVEVDTNACTLCMACTSACPNSALIDNTETPQLRFIERNCVQCGLCVNTCPENALSLVPQLLLGTQARAKRVLHESQPFHCVSCGKAFGTKHLIESMIQRLSTHSMFSENAKRLSMCGDCRVTDMFRATDEMTIVEKKL